MGDLTELEMSGSSGDSDLDEDGQEITKRIAEARKQWMFNVGGDNSMLRTQLSEASRYYSKCLNDLSEANAVVSESKDRIIGDLETFYDSIARDVITEEEVNEESTLNDQLNITLREQEKCRHEIRRLNAEYAKEEDLLSNSIAELSMKRKLVEVSVAKVQSMVRVACRLLGMELRLGTPDRPGNLEIKFCKLIEHSNIDAALMLDISLDPVKVLRHWPDVTEDMKELQKMPITPDTLTKFLVEARKVLKAKCMSDILKLSVDQ